MSEENYNPENGAGESIIEAPRILSEQGCHVTHPAYINCLSWIERERLTFKQFQERCAEKGLPEPTVWDWADTFVLTWSELENLNIHLAAQVGDMCELERYFVVRHLGKADVQARHKLVEDGLPLLGPG